MEGMPNCRNKGAVLNLSGVVWTDLMQKPVREVVPFFITILPHHIKHK